jgi:hypothetical protein
MADAANPRAVFATVSVFVANLTHPRVTMKRGTITTQMEKQVNGWASANSIRRGASSSQARCGGEIQEAAPLAVGLRLAVAKRSGT